MATIPVFVQKEYELFQQGKRRFSTMELSVYNAMCHRFRKYGLERGIVTETTVSKTLPKDEYDRRYKARRKKWLEANPGYNKIYWDRYAAKQKEKLAMAQGS